MRRFLPLLVSLAVAVSTPAQPVAGCVSGNATVGRAAHDCCSGEARLATSPAQACCAVSQPARDRALTESRYVNTHNRSAAVPLFAIRARTRDSDLAKCGASAPPAPAPSTVPIYLQQLALLI